MNPIIMTLIFSVVMLMFMAFPAMKITEWLSSKKEFSHKAQNVLTIGITIVLSLMVGLFLETSL